jgi:hypothetical protein
VIHIPHVNSNVPDSEKFEVISSQSSRFIMLCRSKQFFVAEMAKAELVSEGKFATL